MKQMDQIVEKLYGSLILSKKVFQDLYSDKESFGSVIITSLGYHILSEIYHFIDIFLFLISLLYTFYN